MSMAPDLEEENQALREVYREISEERDRLRTALQPFANAWNTVTANEAVVRSCSLGQIGHLCGCEISGVDFQRAAQATV